MAHTYYYLSFVVFCTVFFWTAATTCGAASRTACPREHVKKRRQCIPRSTRLLPLRSLLVWQRGKETATPHLLLDKRLDTSLALTPNKPTIVKTGTGNLKYLVFRVELLYKNPTNRNVPVSVCIKKKHLLR